MGEALVLLLDFAFGELRLRRIEADVDPLNAASVRTLERLGFQREGLLRERWFVGGVPQDSYFYGLLQREWDAVRPALRAWGLAVGAVADSRLSRARTRGLKPGVGQESPRNRQEMRPVLRLQPGVCGDPPVE